MQLIKLKRTPCIFQSLTGIKNYVLSSSFTIICSPKLTTYTHDSFPPSYELNPASVQAPLYLISPLMSGTCSASEESWSWTLQLQAAPKIYAESVYLCRRLKDGFLSLPEFRQQTQASDAAVLEYKTCIFNKFLFSLVSTGCCMQKIHSVGDIFSACFRRGKADSQNPQKGFLGQWERKEWFRSLGAGSWRGC